MDLNIFNNSNSPKNIAGSFSDTSKVSAIADKLCAKRKSLEDSMKVADDATKDTYIREVLEIQNDMRTFGISEIDYHIYVAQQEKNPS